MANYQKILKNTSTYGANKPYVDSKIVSASSPLTTKGDVYTFSTSGARLPVGSNGQVLQADSTEATGLKWVTSTSSNYYADSLSFNTGNGVLTIGRTSPLADLTVDLDGRYITSGIAGSIATDQIAVGTGTDTIGGASTFTYDDSTDAVTLSSATASKPTFTLTNTNADATSPFLIFNKNTASPAVGDNLGYIRFDGKDSAGGSPTYADIFAQSTNVTNTTEEGAIRFRTSTGGSMADLMILSGSNVGIGTTAPSEKLDVQGSILVDPSTGSDTAGTSAGIKFNAQDDSGVGWNLRLGDSSDDGDFNIDRLYSSTWYKSASIDRSTGDFIWYDDDGSTAKMLWDASTNRLGIGTTAPAEKLSIVGGNLLLGTNAK